MYSLQKKLHFRQVFNEGQIVVVKENIRNAWTELLQILRNFKESAKNLTDPRILGEQLQIIFRDESELTLQLKLIFESINLYI